MDVMTATPAIAVANLSVTFTSGLRRIAAVQEVSFEVAGGETFGSWASPALANRRC